MWLCLLDKFGWRGGKTQRMPLIWFKYTRAVFCSVYSMPKYSKWRHYRTLRTLWNYTRDLITPKTNVYWPITLAMKVKTLPAPSLPHGEVSIALKPLWNRSETVLEPPSWRLRRTALNVPIVFQQVLWNRPEPPWNHRETALKPLRNRSANRSSK